MFCHETPRVSFQDASSDAWRCSLGVCVGPGTCGLETWWPGRGAATLLPFLPSWFLMETGEVKDDRDPGFPTKMCCWRGSRYIVICLIRFCSSLWANPLTGSPAEASWQSIATPLTPSPSSRGLKRVISKLCCAQCFFTFLKDIIIYSRPLKIFYMSVHRGGSLVGTQST